MVPLPTDGAPAPRALPGIARVGRHVVVWGGRDDRIVYGDGATYDLDARTWSPIPEQGAPSARVGHCMVSVGAQVVVWGGSDTDNNAYAFDPTANAWSVEASVSGSPQASAKAPARSSVDLRVVIRASSRGAPQVGSGGLDVAYSARLWARHRLG